MIFRVLNAITHRDRTRESLEDNELEKLQFRLEPILNLREVIVKHLTSTKARGVTHSTKAHALKAYDQEDGNVAIGNVEPIEGNRPFERIVSHDKSLQEVVQSLNALANDIVQLWLHPTTKKVLSEQGLNLEEDGGL